MVLGPFADLTDEAHSGGARFRNKETGATMTGIIPVVMVLNKASIYTILDLVLNLVNLVLCGGVRTMSYHRPFELGFELKVHLDQVFGKKGLGAMLQKPRGISG